MLEFMNTMFESFAHSLKSVLPLSPFSRYIAQFKNLPYLGWINWLLPIGPAINVLTAWLGAIAAFYGYSIILRWIKALGD